MEQEIQKTGEVILYHPSETIKLEVRLENETVWLTQAQMAELFNVKIPAVNKHINNIYSEGELDKDSTISILETVRTEGTRKVIRKVVFYNLDVIISVGYRIKSFAGTKFRQWANSVLKDYLIKGYAINNNVLATMQKQIDDRFFSLQEHTNNRLHDMEKHLEQHDEQIAFFIRTNQPPIEGVFYEGQVLDARDFAESLIKSAQKEVLLIDNYIDARTFEILEVRGNGVSAAIYVERVGSGLRTLQQVSLQQTDRQIELRETTQRIHDRFIIIDDVVYHLGASLNELGRRLFAFSKMSIRKEQILYSF